MNAAQRNIIQRNYVALVRDLQSSDGFLNHFVPKRIFTPDMIEEILAEPTNMKRNKKFFTNVQKKGTYAFDEMYDALIATYQFDVADILKPELAPSRSRASLPVEEQAAEPQHPTPGGRQGGRGDEDPSSGGATGSTATSDLWRLGYQPASPVHEEVDYLPSSPSAPPRPQDDGEDSDLSDSQDFFNESDPTLDFISLRVEPCRKKRIQDLFNSKKVYKMSGPTRGRCLIINNKSFVTPTASDQSELSDRPGSEMDVKNISTVFQRLKFTYDAIHKDLSSQAMIDVIKEETSNLDHKDYGMFVLVIMTHGSETHLYGSDGRSIHRSKIHDLMAAQRFPAMAGKPKLLILQACAGDRKDPVGGFRTDNAGLRPDARPTQPPPSATPSPTVHGDYTAADDLFIMRASFFSYVSTRHERQGTWFIRAIVEALYKHACHRDIKTLFETQVMKKVRRKSLEANRKYGYTSGQVPTIECFPTMARKLYLFPEYNPRN